MLIEKFINRFGFINFLLTPLNCRTKEALIKKLLKYKFQVRSKYRYWKTYQRNSNKILYEEHHILTNEKANWLKYCKEKLKEESESKTNNELYKEYNSRILSKRKENELTDVNYMYSFWINEDGFNKMLNDLKKSLSKYREMQKNLKVKLKYIKKPKDSKRLENLGLRLKLKHISDKHRLIIEPFESKYKRFLQTINNIDYYDCLIGCGIVYRICNTQVFFNKFYKFLDSYRCLKLKNYEKSDKEYFTYNKNIYNILPRISKMYDNLRKRGKISQDSVEIISKSPTIVKKLGNPVTPRTVYNWLRKYRT